MIMSWRSRGRNHVITQSPQNLKFDGICVARSTCMWAAGVSLSLSLSLESCTTFRCHPSNPNSNSILGTGPHGDGQRKSPPLDSEDESHQNIVGCCDGILLTRPHLQGNSLTDRLPLPGHVKVVGRVVEQKNMFCKRSTTIHLDWLQCCDVLWVRHSLSGISLNIISFTTSRPVVRVHFHQVSAKGALQLLHWCMVCAQAFLSLAAGLHAHDDCHPNGWIKTLAHPKVVLKCPQHSSTDRLAWARATWHVWWQIWSTFNHHSPIQLEKLTALAHFHLVQ